MEVAVIDFVFSEDIVSGDIIKTPAGILEEVISAFENDNGDIHIRTEDDNEFDIPFGHSVEVWGYESVSF